MIPTDTRILFMHYGGEPIRGSERMLIDLVTGLAPGIEPVVWCNSSALARELSGLHVPAHTSRMSVLLHYTTPHFDFRNYLALIRTGKELVDRYGISLIHANSGAPVQWGVPIARSRKIPLIAHLHAPYNARDRAALLLHQASVIVGCSRTALHGFAADGTPPQRLRVILNGVDAARLRRGDATRLRDELGIPDQAVVVSAVGALVSGKGFDVLLRAAAVTARAATSPIYYLLIGDGPARRELEALATQLGIESAVRFLGERQDVGAILRDAVDLFALPSLSEAMPLVFIEAAIFGVPAVGTDVGGIPDVVVNGRTGLLVPLEDAQALATAILKLASDPQLRAAMGAAAQERALAEFAIEQTRGQFSRLYRELAAQPRSAFGWRSSGFHIRPWLRYAVHFARQRVSSAAKGRGK